MEKETFVRRLYARVSTFRFTGWLFYGSCLKVSGRKERNWRGDVDKTDRKCKIREGRRKESINVLNS